METSTEAPAAAAPAVELSLSDIIAAEVAKADAVGAETVKVDAPAEAKPEGADATPAAEAAAAEEPAAEPTEEAKPDDVSAARVRKMLQTVAEKEQALAAREADFESRVVAEILRNPNAALAKVGKSVDDLIDASIAERKGEPAAERPAAEAEPAWAKSLREKMEARERAEAAATTKATIDAKLAEIHGNVAKSDKFPTLNAKVKAGDVEASVVTDYMQSYFEIHGKPVSWFIAATTVEADLRKLVGAPAPVIAKPAAPAPKERPGTVSIGGETRTSAPVDGEEPSDPHDLMRYLAAKHNVI